MVRTLVICIALLSFYPADASAKLSIQKSERHKICPNSKYENDFCGSWKYLELIKDNPRDKYNKPGVQNHPKRWYGIGSKKKKKPYRTGSIVLEGVVFRSGTTVLIPGSLEALKMDAAELKKEAPRKFDIIGNADSRGTESYNIGLSQSRAKVIYDIFVKEGINPSRMNAYGRGESRPIDSNYTNMGQTRNRRIELYLHY